ncbi:hypothetical protein [Dyella sp. 2HG41-7]|uniref:hypothetical protein n=1 Tax=Dyella sp. 2HG41-7 TaxID=2883239 RepID=UPI001F2E4D31|nr:hypothetical protein [Dyella sp. 2HG41-7]
MRSRLAILCLTLIPAVALADSVHTIEVRNDTHSRIDSFAMAPAGSNRWVEKDFTAPMGQFEFDYQLAVTLRFYDNDGCLRDLRTVLSDGRRIVARNFDVCQLHVYRPGRRFYDGHAGSPMLP